jgi:signal transduction histidine kinase
VRIARLPLEPHIGAKMNDIIPYARGGQLQGLITEVARDGQVRETTVLSSRDTRDPTRAVSIKVFPLPEKHVGVAVEDITSQTVTRKLQEAEQHVLEMLAEGAPLVTVLSSLVLAVEAHSPPTIGAIHLRDADGTRYPERVAPSLRISTDELHVYAATPILATDERDLGDFVLYVREPKRVVDDDVGVIERAANLARIAIERRQLEDQLRELSAHAESVREDERTGIAREIHDQLGQSLTALKMDIAWIVRRSQAGQLEKPALLEKLGSMSTMTDEIIQQVRRISAELRPGVLDDLGLVAAIEWQAQEFEARTGTACTVRASATLPALDRSATTAVFRILQEALTNVTRHAEAKHVVVQLWESGGWLALEVQDDGKGISPEAARGRKSLGLLGIRERALRLGGNVSVTAATPRGTLLSLRVPLARTGTGTGTGTPTSGAGSGGGAR